MMNDDEFHQKKKVGKGIYFTQKIRAAEEKSEIIRINDEVYKIVLMVKIKHEFIRRCKNLLENNYFVINGNIDEVRPYRILYKKI